MNFNDKTKRIICIVIAVAMIVPIALGVIFTLMGI